MSRLQAGALSLFPRPAGLDEIVSRALDNLDPAARGITVDIPDSLPEINVDPAILERVIVNLTENALRYSPPGQPPLLTASALGDRVELRVVDRGPGHPREGHGTGCSCRSSGSATPTTRPGSASGWRCRAGLTEAMGGTLDRRGHAGRRADHDRVAAGAAPPDYDYEPGRRERGATSERAGVHR